MRSYLIIEVEHGETTDGLQDFVQSAQFLDTPKTHGVLVRDYSLAIDVPKHTPLPDEVAAILSS